MRDSFAVELPLRALFEAPTIAKLREKLSRRRDLEQLAQDQDVKARIAAMSLAEVQKDERVIDVYLGRLDDAEAEAIA